MEDSCEYFLNNSLHQVFLFLQNLNQLINFLLTENIYIYLNNYNKLDSHALRRWPRSRQGYSYLANDTGK